MAEDRSLNPRTQRSKVSPDELTSLAREMEAGSSRELDLVGGARTGWLNYSYPLARLRADQERLAVQVFHSTFQFSRSEIVGLQTYRGWFFRGVQIHHEKASAPRRLVFWPPGSTDDLLQELSALGWPVR